MSWAIRSFMAGSPTFQKTAPCGDGGNGHRVVSLLGDLTIDRHVNPLDSGLHGLTHSLQITTLRRGLAGFREAGDDVHRSSFGEFSGRHRAVGIIEPERKWQIL